MKRCLLLWLAMGWAGLLEAVEPGEIHPVRLGKKFGFVDQKGTLVRAADLDWAWPLTEGRAGVRMGKDWFLINERGQMQRLAGCDWVGPFSEGLAPARSGRKWGYLGRDGKWKIEPYYSCLLYTSDAADE